MPWEPDKGAYADTGPELFTDCFRCASGGGLRLRRAARSIARCAIHQPFRLRILRAARPSAGGGRALLSRRRGEAFKDHRRLAGQRARTPNPPLEGPDLSARGLRVLRADGRHRLQVAGRTGRANRRGHGGQPLCGFPGRLHSQRRRLPDAAGAGADLGKGKGAGRDPAFCPGAPVPGPAAAVGGGRRQSRRRRLARTRRRPGSTRSRSRCPSCRRC